MTWSGRFYVAMPLWFVLVAGAALLGARIGQWLTHSDLPRTSGTVFSAWAAPVILAFIMVDLGAPAALFESDPWEDATLYRGGCLVGTEFIDPTAQISMQSETITFHSTESDRQLRFISTDEPWPSLARADVNGRGIIPVDRATIETLASIGCD
ncbi:hypothetical protein ACIQUM_36175 [Amycolatopsis azurea]|uniref:hypothetical protein n=1 Tax=Amycolatopsis azurea TaxID=36819 RepID=UPI0038201F6C